MSDNIPEVGRSFTLQIVSVTFARVDINATTVEIFVPASDNPHGTVEFASSAPVLTSEGAAVELDIVRREGLIGALLVNFTAVPGSADESDFTITDSCKCMPIN